jgi:hypothetical protein
MGFFGSFFPRVFELHAKKRDKKKQEGGGSEVSHPLYHIASFPLPMLRASRQPPGARGEGHSKKTPLTSACI